MQLCHLNSCISEINFVKAPVVRFKTLNGLQSEQNEQTTAVSVIHLCVLTEIMVDEGVGFNLGKGILWTVALQKCPVINTALIKKGT